MTLDLARQAQRALETWLLSDEAMALPVHELEVVQERRAREVQRLMLQAHVEARGRGDVGPAVLLRQGRPSSADSATVRTTAAGW